MAAVLGSLGVDLGAPDELNACSESQPLANELRQWWDEPFLVNLVAPIEKQRYLTRWIQGLESRGAAAVAAKHPLLSLCLADLRAAWGENVRILWSHRNIEDSIKSLRRMNWGWPTIERIQQTLWSELDKPENRDFLLKVHYEKLVESPSVEIDKLIDGLGLLPSKEQRDTAIDLITSHRNKQFNKKHTSLTTARSNTKPVNVIATMLSDSQQDSVFEAVTSSIAFVDKFLLIDTGITDNTAEVVRNVAGTKFDRIRYEWTGSFADARNFALEVAAQHGADWAFTVDSDERFVFAPGFDQSRLKEVLNSKPEIQAWMMCVLGGEYSKERFIRVPAKLKWKGSTHETLVGYGENLRDNFRFGYFWEPAKGNVAFRAKLDRDLQALQKEIQRSPFDPRWWYYLGQTYEGMREFDKAIEAFQKCAALDGWAGESASAYFRAAMCLKELGRYREAETCAATGLSRTPRSAELFWLAGFCAYQLGAMDRAIQWCELSIQCGDYLHNNSTQGQVELTFRYVPASYEAPFDILRYAYHKIGEQQKCDEAGKHYRRAKRIREFDRSLPIRNVPSTIN